MMNEVDIMIELESLRYSLLKMTSAVIEMNNEIEVLKSFIIDGDNTASDYNENMAEFKSRLSFVSDKSGSDNFLSSLNEQINASEIRCKEFRNIKADPLSYLKNHKDDIKNTITKELEKEGTLDEFTTDTLIDGFINLMSEDMKNE